jgi:hypothetical protein
MFKDINQFEALEKGVKMVFDIAAIIDKEAIEYEDDKDENLLERRLKALKLASDIVVYLISNDVAAGESYEKSKEKA